MMKIVGTLTYSLSDGTRGSFEATKTVPDSVNPVHVLPSFAASLFNDLQSVPGSRFETLTVSRSDEPAAA